MYKIIQIVFTALILNDISVSIRSNDNQDAYPCHDKNLCKCVKSRINKSTKVTCHNFNELEPDAFNNSESKVKDLLLIIGGSDETALSDERFSDSAPLGYNEIVIENACINYVQPYFFLKRLQTKWNPLWRISLTYSVCLTTLENFAFSDLTGLQVLDLSANSLHQIHDSALGNLTRLETLYLQHNRLTHLNNLTFADLSSLVTLDLSHNDLFSISRGAFAKLTRLKTLLLNNNHLLKLPDGVFASLSIYTLNVSNNKLTKFQPNLVAGTTRESLTSLSLDFNKLQYLSQYVMDLENANPGNVELSVRGNDWYCSCRLIWMKDSENFIVQSSVRCSEPLIFAGKTLEGIKSFELCPGSQGNSRNSSSTVVDKSLMEEADNNEYVALICGILVVIVAVVILFGIYRYREKVCKRRNTLLRAKKDLYRQTDNNEEIPFNETPFDTDGDGILDNSNNHRNNEFLTIQNVGV